MIMKNQKAYDRKVYAILTFVLVGVALLFAQACNRELENATPKSKAVNVDHATSIYEVEFDGAKYIVIDTYRGVGICPKAGEIIWTKEVK